MKIKIIALLLTIIGFSIGKDKGDNLYLNYLKSVKQSGTFQYFLVIRIKNLNTGEQREICTKGNFLKGALKREKNISFEEIDSLVFNNKDRYFEFQKDSAMRNLGVRYYSMKDLNSLENLIDFDSLARKIKKSRKWSLLILDDKKMKMYAHALFNRGVLTGESSCHGGTLIYIDKQLEKEMEE